MELMTDKGYCLKYLSPELRDNKEVVSAAVQSSAFAIFSASGRLQRDPDVLELQSNNTPNIKIMTVFSGILIAALAATASQK
jgi:hypothetical protein